MESGSIAIASLQQADGLIKNRPVLILSEVPPHGDYLVCGISSQVKQTIGGVDVLLEAGEPGFEETRLRCSSVIRTRYLATLPTTSIKGTLGQVPTAKLDAVYQSLHRLFENLKQSTGAS